MKTKDIVEFFDPSNIKHIEAYHTLMVKGSWPIGFADELIASSGWMLRIPIKITEYYVSKEAGIHGWWGKWVKKKK